MVRSNYWDGGIATGTRNQWGYKLVGNSVHDSYGECVDVLERRRRDRRGEQDLQLRQREPLRLQLANVTLNRNWIYANTDQYNRPDLGYRAAGIQLGERGQLVGWSLNNVRDDQQHRRVGEPGHPLLAGADAAGRP